MSFPLACLLVMATTFASAWCWPVYIRACSERKAWKAALADVALILLGMISVVGYVEDHRLAFPILFAAFVGTYWVVRK
jgi:hypothetical protein